MRSGWTKPMAAGIFVAIASSSILVSIASSPASTAVRDGSAVVSDRKALMRAIDRAQPGSTILLAPADYGVVTINRASFERPIKLKSLRSSQPARFGSIKITDSHGLELENLLVEPGASKPRMLIEIGNSSQIRLKAIEMTSSLAAADALAVRGLYVRNSRGITLQSSRMSRIYLGAFFGNSSNITVENNVFEALLGDGIDFAGVDKAIVKGNVFQSFAHTGGSHADAIQIFTTHATGSSDVLIEDNRILQKNGTPMQGILISSQNQSRHSNITVRNNLVLTNDMPLGIAVYASDGVTIAGNVVASTPRSKWETKLYVSSSTRTTVENNTTTRLVIDGKLRRGGNGNKVIKPVDDDRIARMQADFQARGD